MRGASIPKSSPSSSSVRRTRPNTVRIIGGLWRSRLIEFPDAADLRPTPDRVRETLFNWLGQDLNGMACLDLFAGSGALGFESRGEADYADRLLSAMRKQFGGHEEKKE